MTDKPREVRYPLRQPSERLREAFKHLHLHPHFQEVEKEVRAHLKTVQSQLITEHNDVTLRNLQGQAQALELFTSLIDYAKEPQK